jgi:uncharacterized protein with PIN domain
MLRREKMELKGRLNGMQRNRLKRLLNMPYKPSELAAELGFNQDRVYMTYIRLGCPHERGNNRQIWINGKEFRDWYREHYQKPILQDDEAFCLTCRCPVEICEPERMSKGGLVFDLSNCPVCGRRIAKIIGQAKRQE